jgi:hypothetical protein
MPITFGSSGGGGGSSAFADITGSPSDNTALATALDAKAAGAASSTDNAIVRFDGTTGKIIQNSGATLDDSNNIITAGDFRTGTSGTLRFSSSCADGLAGIDFDRAAAATADRKTLTYSSGGAGSGGAMYFESGSAAYIAFGGHTDGNDSNPRMFLYGTGAHLRWATDGGGQIGKSAGQSPSAIFLKSFACVRPITEAARDALTAEDGMIVYNSTAGKLQCYGGGVWNNLF